MNKKPILSERMKQIVKVIKPCSVLAEIGCDHGKICYEVLHAPTAQFVFASDISAQSVEKAQKLLSGTFENFKTLVSDGVLNYTDSEKKIINTLVIAGLGGREMIQILTQVVDQIKKFPNLKQLVLQPQNNTILVRQFLNQIPWSVQLDTMLWEKPKFYDILSVAINPPKKLLTNRQIVWGKTNLVTYNPHFEHFLNVQMEKTEHILQHIQPSKRSEFIKKQNEIQKLLATQQKRKQKSC